MKPCERDCGTRLGPRLSHHRLDAACARARFEVIDEGARIEDRLNAGGTQPQADVDIFPAVLENDSSNPPIARIVASGAETFVVQK